MSRLGACNVVKNNRNNYEMMISEDRKTLTITVDLTVKGEPSASGKTTVVSTTGGFVKVNGHSVSFNVIKK